MNVFGKRFPEKIAPLFFFIPVQVFHPHMNKIQKFLAKIKTQFILDRKNFVVMVPEILNLRE